MIISKIDFSLLSDHTSKERWGANTKRDRHLYSDGKFWFKIWGADYLSVSNYACGASFVKYEPKWGAPHGFEVGLFDSENSCAFDDFIFDEKGRIRGYITKSGTNPSKSAVSDFSQTVFEKCRRVGWIYSDFCFNNLVKIGNDISLIDFDTHLSSYENFDISFEEKSGSLRNHVYDEFRKRIYSDILGDRDSL